MAAFVMWVKHVSKDASQVPWREKYDAPDVKTKADAEKFGRAAVEEYNKTEKRRYKETATLRAFVSVEMLP
jgi:hypothetical protein